ncbi:hypothetical protein ACKI1I_04295 [Streptomyces turgidiscabies]|uniref:Calcium-binding protein n=1 Tax=Streptomyces turgidiscabies (strain Car8) TaxID=698760 RepID=L7FAL2_STRT8|nr:MULTISPECIES: hypothetical protein [Streptomyces]ELP68603.1 hypothetical protein STRTUCAR8_03594 [Streptomyces turgidiscabies Car8]MDX3494069.1 hypothetical protein [Streptomyces turgidiscabies]GAQ68561.1 hypothetical protein T45_00272 [Streptomyces turgidiscabies]
MRTNTAATGISGAVLLSTLVLPGAAQAAEHPGAETDLRALASRSVQPRDAIGDTTFKDAVVNNGKDIVLGVTGKKAVPITFTAFDEEGLALTQAFLWQGTDSSSTDTITGALGTDADPVCTETTVQGGYSYKCKAVFTIDPAVDFKDGNGTAGAWKIFLGAFDLYLNISIDDDVARTSIKRAAALTVNASPEPVKKGKNITVTGKLNRADWTTGKNSGYATQPVKLQFRKKGSTTYTTLKTVKTSRTGTLSTTTKAGVDGYYRYVFAGTFTTGSATSAADFIDVK